MPRSRPLNDIFHLCIQFKLLKVYRNHEEVVALFDWTPGNHFGRAVIGAKQIPMSQLVLPGSVPK
jgi:hypothetical protein